MAKDKEFMRDVREMLKSNKDHHLKYGKGPKKEALEKKKGSSHSPSFMKSTYAMMKGDSKANIKSMARNKRKTDKNS